jgi:predicted nucleic acid-binding protein
MRADGDAFLDSNVLLYLLSADTAKADRAESLMAAGGTISVQVLNEFASVASRKLGMAWGEIRDVLSVARDLCVVRPLTVETHDRALELVGRHSLSFYDSLIVAAALEAGCRTLWSEDLQDGKRFGSRLVVRNPFTAVAGDADRPTRKAR